MEVGESFKMRGRGSEDREANRWPDSGLHSGVGWVKALLSARPLVERMSLDLIPSA